MLYMQWACITIEEIGAEKMQIFYNVLQANLAIFPEGDVILITLDSKKKKNAPYNYIFKRIQNKRTGVPHLQNISACRRSIGFSPNNIYFHFCSILFMTNYPMSMLLSWPH